MRTLLALLCLSFAARAGVADAPQGVPWITSQKDAAAQAKAANKPLLIFLHADYCEWCKVMEDGAFQDSRVRLLAGEYVPCRLNGEREGKSLVQKYHVVEYPCVAAVAASGELIAQNMGKMDSDECVHFLSVNAPPEAVAVVDGASPGDAPALALRAVIHAERGEVVAAAAALASLSATGPVPDDLTAAADHALGLAYTQRGDDADAVLRLQKAVAAAPSPREIVQLHFLIADCCVRLHRQDDAVAELEAVRHLHDATKDEKKDAKKREESLLTQSDKSSKPST